AFAVAVFLVSLPLDAPAYRLFEDTHTSDTWWHRGLKALGWAPLWLAVAAVLLVIDATRHKTLGWKNVFARPALLAFACGLGGLIAEVLKLLLRRLRPGVADGEYLLRPFTVDPLSSNNLGLPSSHAMVAFAACMMAGRLWPKLAPLFWLFAAGCGLSRVMAEAHFVSDVALAAACAWPAVAMLWWWNRREVERHHLVPWPPPLRRELERDAQKRDTQAADERG
ncbi:MAG: phosphatase PAP2 family protein, partial [Phycisphaeraceae bacterium]